MKLFVDRMALTDQGWGECEPLIDPTWEHIQTAIEGLSQDGQGVDIYNEAETAQLNVMMIRGSLNAYHVIYEAPGGYGKIVKSFLLENQSLSSVLLATEFFCRFGEMNPSQDWVEENLSSTG